MSKKIGVHFGRKYDASAKAELRLSGIFFTTSTHVETVVMLSHKKPDSVINVKVEFGEVRAKYRLTISLREPQRISRKSE